MTEPQPIRVDTRHGEARVHLHTAVRPADDAPRGLLVLGHGAGGGVGAPDLVTVTAAARDAGLTVALVEQPYRVAGRRAPPRAPTLDAAWTDVLTHLRRGELGRVPLVVGGRSSGARVACRTAAAGGAVAVLCLAFPLQPVTRAGAEPRPTRLPELESVGVPVLVVQGARDPFGVPPAAPGRTVVTVTGDHALRGDGPAVDRAVATWLGVVLADAPPDDAARGT
ncbi:alpha/beta family hydrolase [Cellulomonas sp. ATA003]|uniref:alpha/beta hydrolase family protein n=1 Tax=Cellulomonas sp. ATA003 TaxID=3073064 RepID=UPI00287373A1|nr:alpha/beta family hydrolase [Cellulomonas sp. ATA003]WNB86936.1 alpha/beta hydrolase [Cellulomonas sp. ATA003]